MTAWVCDRVVNGWRLERSRDGLARLVDPHGRATAPMSIGKALAQISLQAQAGERRQVIFVHGMLGEREGFAALADLLGGSGWDCQYFRYASHTASFETVIRNLSRQIARVLGTSERICVIGHSFGCRLIAAALPREPSNKLDIVMIAPPTQQVDWAKRGMAFAPARRFLGGSLADMAHNTMATPALETHNLLVIEGGGGGGDGWLKPAETALPGQHRRVAVNADHRRLTCAAESLAAVSSFLSL